MSTDDAHEVAALDDVGASARVLGVTRHFLRGVQHPYLALGHYHGDRLADQLPRHAVAVGVQFDAGVGVHPAAEFAYLQKRRLGRQRRECASFVTLEAVDGWLGGGAMYPHVCHLAHPARQMRLEFFE
jgi:hypothetical protein